MDTSVKLQDMFSFSLVPIYIVAGLIGAIILYFIIDFIVRKIKSRPKKEVTKKQEIVVKKPVNVSASKEKYIEKLVILENEYNNGTCDVRNAYQQMSAIIRDFVFDVTGIKVQNYTLLDIKGLNMPVLEELIEEYYSPEFEEQSEGNVKVSLDKTKAAIERWT